MRKRSFALVLFALLCTLIVPGVSYSQTVSYSNTFYSNTSYVTTNDPSVVIISTIFPATDSSTTTFTSPEVTTPVKVIFKSRTRGVISSTTKTIRPFIIEGTKPVPLIGGDGINFNITYARDPITYVRDPNTNTGIITNTSTITNLDLDIRSRDGEPDVINSDESTVISVNIERGNIAAVITDNMLVTSGDISVSGGNGVNTVEFKGVNTSTTVWVGNNSKIALERYSAGGGAALAVQTNSGSVTISGNASAGEIYSLSFNSYAVNIISATPDGALISELDIWTSDGKLAVISTDALKVSSAQIWSNKSDAGTIQAKTVSLWNGAKVWSDGARSDAILATAVLVDNSEVWTGNRFNSNTIVSDTVNVSSGGKVWASSSSGIAVVSGSSDSVTIESEDGTGEIWVKGSSTVAVKAVRTAVINDLKVWANGSRSQAVTAGAVVTVNGANVWTIGGQGSETIVAALVNIWNGANVWANGSRSNAVKATSAPVTVIGANVWTIGGQSNTILAPTVNIWNGANVWANGPISNAIKATTVGIQNSVKVWTGGFRSDAVVSDSARVYSSEVWTEGNNANTIIANSLIITAGGKVWANGAGSRAVSAGSGGGLAIAGTGEIWTTGDGALTLRADRAFIRQAKVWANGATTNALAVTENATIRSGSQIWTEGDNSNAVVVASLFEIYGGSKVWAEGASSSAINATSGTLTIESRDGAGEVWTTADSASTAGITTEVTIHGIKLWANGATTDALATTATGTVTLNGASVWAEGADSNAITAQDVLLSGATAGANSATGGGGIVATGTVKVFNGSNVWTHGAAKSAITGADISISGSNVWSTGDSPVNPVIPETGRTSLTITDGSKVWSNGAGTFVITSFSEGFDLNGVSVWSEGAESITIQTGSAVNVVNGAVVGANGAAGNAIKIQTGGDVTVNGSKVWAVREGITTAGGVSITNGSEVWATGTSGTGTAVKGATVHISGSKVWSAHAGNPAVGGIVGAVNVIDSFIALNGAGANAVDAVDAGAGPGGTADLPAVVLAVNDSTVMAVAGSSGISAVGTRVVGGVHVIVNSSTIKSAGGRAAQVRADKGTATLDIVNSPLTAVAGAGSAVHVSSSYVAGTQGTELGVRVYLANSSIATETSGASVLSVDASGSTERTEITLVGDSRIEAVGSGVVSQVGNGETKIIISDKSRVVTGGSGDTIKATSVDGAIGLYVNGAAAAADAPLENPDSAYVSSGQSNTNTVRLQTRNGSTTVSLQGGAQVIAGFPQYGTAARAIHANSADGDINIALGGTSQVAMRGHFLADAIVAETRNGDISFSMSGDSRLSVIPDRSSAFSGVSSGSGDVAITVSGQAKVWAVQKQSHALYGVSGSGNVLIRQASHSTAVYTEGIGSTAIRASAGGNASIETSGILFVNGDNRSTAAHASSSSANARVDIIFRTPSGGTPAVRYANGTQSKYAVAESAGADATVNSYHSSSSDVTHVISLPGGQAEGLNATTTGAPRTNPQTGASAVSVHDIEATVRLGGRTLVNASGTGGKAIIARADTGYANVIIDEGSAVYAKGAAGATSGIGISASTANGGAFVWVDGTVNVTGGKAIKMSAGAKGWSGTLGYDNRIVTINATGKVYGDIDTSAVVGGASVTIAAGGTYEGTNITTSSRRSASSGGDGRFRLGSAGTAEFVETEPEKSGGGSLNFGDSDGDTLTVNGTLVISGGETINGLEKISFGANSTLVITADPESVAGDPLIDLEGTITAEDVEGFNVEVEVPGAHVTEYTIFEAEALPEGEERQEVADRLSAEIGERITVETDENGNLFLRATSHKDTSLDVYDALIQSAYRSDRNFADKLARGCGISGAASDEIEGEFWTGGCVWATSGGRYTRHTSAIQYDEDVYSFTGGFSAPFSGVLVSIAGGYEISDIDASSETETAADTRGLGKASGDATRFMGGIFAEALVDEFVLDGNLRYGSTSWEATRTAGNSYSADVDATVFGGEIGAARPFLMGEFAFFPRVAVGASQITADKFNETSLTTGTGAADAAMDAFGVDEISELLVYVSPSIEARSPLNETINMWIRTGADIQVLNPESEIEGRLERDNVPVDGTMDRVMFTYGAGFEYSPYEKFNVSVEYGGGVSSSVDTFVQQFRGGVNYRF